MELYDGLMWIFSSAKLSSLENELHANDTPRSLAPCVYNMLLTFTYYASLGSSTASTRHVATSSAPHAQPPHDKGAHVACCPIVPCHVIVARMQRRRVAPDAPDGAHVAQVGEPVQEALLLARAHAPAQQHLLCATAPEQRTQCALERVG